MLNKQSGFPACFTVYIIYRTVPVFCYVPPTPPPFSCSPDANRASCSWPYQGSVADPYFDTHPPASVQQKSIGVKSGHGNHTSTDDHHVVRWPRNSVAAPKATSAECLWRAEANRSGRWRTRAALRQLSAAGTALPLDLCG
ncbi:hypothetical protein PG993_009943 [Apiospora rasikravindrae]|uniref:Uncharacterized protein n=1 Tax=Apiospora rasikravindrae TaxID=990691 RepID=A0ABR1SKU3_9PEZI